MTCSMKAHLQSLVGKRLEALDAEERAWVENLARAGQLVLVNGRVEAT